MITLNRQGSVFLWFGAQFAHCSTSSNGLSGRWAYRCTERWKNRTSLLRITVLQQKAEVFSCFHDGLVFKNRIQKKPPIWKAFHWCTHSWVTTYPSDTSKGYQHNGTNIGRNLFRQSGGYQILLLPNESRRSADGRRLSFHSRGQDFYLPFIHF